VGVSAVPNRVDLDSVLVLVDPINDPVRATSGEIVTIEWFFGFADAVRMRGDGSGDPPAVPRASDSRPAASLVVKVRH
jgi:hypothetical protein